MKKAGIMDAAESSLNFLWVFFRKNEPFRVDSFSAAQAPDFAGRIHPRT